MKLAVAGAFMCLLGLGGFGRAARGQELRIGGAPSVIPILEEAAKVLKAEKGYVCIFAKHGGGEAALAALGADEADVAIITRPLTGDDRALDPAAILVEIPIGMQAAAIGVANDVWEGGVHSISKEQMRGIYEQKLKKWSELGGADKKIVLFNFEQGHGIWEMFADWLYGDNRKAFIPKVQAVHSNEDAEGALEFTPGAVISLSPTVVDGVRCHALPIVTGSGQPVAPTAQNVAKGNYPIVRPINLVVNGRPTLAIRGLTEFMISVRGQEIVKKEGAFGLDAVAKPEDNPHF